MREAVEEAKPLLWPTVVVVVLVCTSLGLLEVFMVVVVRTRVGAVKLVQTWREGRRRGEERTVPVFVLPVDLLLPMLL